MTVSELLHLLGHLSPENAHAVLLETVLPQRLVACGEPGDDEDATLWSLSVPDHVARLGFAVRATIIDPEQTFAPSEASRVLEAIRALQ